MKIKFLSFVLILLILVNSFVAAYAQEEQESAKDLTVPTVNRFSYKVQKYTGVNFVAEFISESIIKALLKIKTRAKTTSADLEIYSGWDLVRKKVKGLNIKADKLLVKGIPVHYFEFKTLGPIYLKKNKEGKNQVAIPLKVTSRIILVLKEIDDILNNLPKWQKVFSRIDLPIPPFGTTEIALENIEVTVDDDGVVHFNCLAKSLINPKAEPLQLIFSGMLIVQDKKLVVVALQSEIKDIFTKDSDIGISFSKFLEDLINPVFDFHKYEKNGLTIDSVNLDFNADNMVFDINIKFLPEDEKNEE